MISALKFLGVIEAIILKLTHFAHTTFKHKLNAETNKTQEEFWYLISFGYLNVLNKVKL
jgi:hypothetical protein